MYVGECNCGGRCGPCGGQRLSGMGEGGAKTAGAVQGATAGASAAGPYGAVAGALIGGFLAGDAPSAGGGGGAGAPGAGMPGATPTSTTQISPAIQTQISPQISPAFQQSYMPQNSGMTAGATQTLDTPQYASPMQIAPGTPGGFPGTGFPSAGGYDPTGGLMPASYLPSASGYPLTNTSGRFPALKNDWQKYAGVAAIGVILISGIAYIKSRKARK